MSAALDDTSPTICIFTDHWSWDHWLLFAMTEINSGMYNSTLGDVTFQHKFLFSDPYAVMPEGEAQAVFAANYESCHVFVNPGWTSQLSAIGEWAGIVHKPIITGGATSPIFAEEKFGYVSRSVPSYLYSIEAYVELIKQYGFSLINLVYMNDEWGSSVAQALVGRAGDGFQIQVSRSFESADDVGGIESALDDIQASPTRVTFVCTTGRGTNVFLNAAGKRGMHETQLWLAPSAAETEEVSFDPPSSGGIWAITSGEEMKKDDSLARRYLAKDLAPHIEAQEKYGFNNLTEEITFWGAYYYDAVLAAAHALAAAKNRSDGEEVLKAIHNLSLDNANTGVLEMDEDGERLGARNPVFYITQEGKPVQFALYDGNLDILQDPLWPGGTAVQPKDLIPDDANCRAGSYWSNIDLTCLTCPSLGNITLSEEELTFRGVSKNAVVDSSVVYITNENSSPISLYLKSTPPFISYNGSIDESDQKRIAIVDPDASQLLLFDSSSYNLAAGIAVGEIVIGVSDAGSYLGCVGKDIRLEAVVNVSPEAELNHLGAISIVGWTLVAVLMLVTFITAAWSIKHRKHPAMKKMQPPFLLGLLFGVSVLGSTIIPLSIDDGVASEHGCDVRCMTTPWLLSMGVCISFSALFSKLWRLNRVLGSGFRRITLKEKDVIVPAVILFLSNLVVLICWSAVSPLQWERVAVAGEPWNTVGVCSSENKAVETVSWVALGFINIGALLLCCWQTYKARNHSDELSEARGIAVALFSLLQLTLIGVPVMLLIDQDDVTARYFVTVGLVFVACMSLLVSIFVPIWKNMKQHNSASNRRLNSSTLVSGISGIQQSERLPLTMDNHQPNAKTKNAVCMICAQRVVTESTRHQSLPLPSTDRTTENDQHQMQRQSSV